MTLLSTERHHEHISDHIPQSQDERKKRKKPTAKRKLDAIEELSDESDTELNVIRPSGSTTLTKIFDEEHAEALEAFDAIAVSRKVPNNPPNGLISPSKSAKTTSRKGSGKRK